MRKDEAAKMEARAKYHRETLPLVMQAIASTAAVLLIAGRSEAKTTSPDLDRLLAYSDPRNCKPALGLTRLLDSLVTIAKDTKSVKIGNPITGPEFRSAVGTPHLTRKGMDYTVGLPLKGTWLGLNVDELRRQFVIGNPSEAITVHFNATANQVVTAVIKTGFKIK